MNIWENGGMTNTADWLVNSAFTEMIDRDFDLDRVGVGYVLRPRHQPSRLSIISQGFLCMALFI